MLTYALNRESFLSRYPFLLLLISLCSGIQLQTTAAFTVMPCLLFTMAAWIIALIIHRPRATDKRLQLLRVMAMAASFMGLGTSLSALQDIRNHKNWYGHYLEEASALIVHLEEEPQVKERTVLLPVNIRSIKVADRWLQVSGALRLYIYQKQGMPAYHSGQTLLVPAKLLPVKNSGNPFAFDYAAYAMRQGWHHQAFLPATDIRIITKEQEIKQLTVIRRRLQLSIVANVTDSTTRSLIEATLLNERSSLDEELWKAYSVTGIVHIIAISGMHIVMLAGMLLFILRLLPFARLKRIKYIIAIIVIWCYVALTGFPPSAVRAALMFTLMSIGLILDKTSPPVNIWSATGFLILCCKPQWLYDVGLQLSFLAVLSLLLFYKPIEKRYRPQSIGLTLIWHVVAVSIAVQILVAPLVIYYFHQFPLMGLIANIPAALFSTLLMYGGTILLLLDQAGIPCLWLGELLTCLTKGFHWLIRLLADNTPQAMQQLYIDRYEYWLIMTIVIVLCFFVRYSKRSFLYAASVLLILLIADLIAKDIAAARQEHIVVFNESHASLAEVYRGKYTIPIYNMDTSRKMTNYTLLPARLALRATAIQPTTGHRLYHIHGATVLFLKAFALPEKDHHFPVDFLVVSQQCVFAPEAWYHAFRPRKIIIDGSLPRWKALVWKQKLERMGAHVHWVQDDGAWVFPALTTTAKG